VDNGHPFKLFYLILDLIIVDIIFFAVRVLRIWNSLPKEVVSSDHLSLFVRHLNRVNISQLLVGKVCMF